MDAPKFHNYLHRQIPVLIVLSVIPGLGYIFLGWLHGIHRPAMAWYGLILLMSGWFNMPMIIVGTRGVNVG